MILSGGFFSVQSSAEWREAVFSIISWSFRRFIEDPSIFWDFRNGYVVYGGIIGGVLAS